ncbi:hypothetical protein P9112_004555 [Eukaryota sp. TZLM1-RC]
MLAEDIVDGRERSEVFRRQQSQTNVIEPTDASLKEVGQGSGGDGIPMSLIQQPDVNTLSLVAIAKMGQKRFCLHDSSPPLKRPATDCLCSFRLNNEVISAAFSCSFYLDDCISDTLKMLQVDKTQLSKTRKIIKSVKSQVAQSLPKTSSVVPYGSFATDLLYTSESDIDLTIVSKSLSKTPLSVLHRLVNSIRHRFEDIQLIPSKYCPILKFKDARSQINFDLSIGSTSGLNASMFFKQYLSISPLAVQLCRIVKHWAKCRGLNEAANGGWSSFCLVLMSIRYLMDCVPPLLPPVSELVDVSNLTRSVCGGALKEACRKFKPTKVVDGCEAHNISTLLFGFFSYYMDFEFSTHAISILNPNNIRYQKAYKKLSKTSKFKPSAIIIDPLDQTNNAARAVIADVLLITKVELKRAIDVMKGKQQEKLFDSRTQLICRQPAFGECGTTFEADLSSDEDDDFKFNVS